MMFPEDRLSGKARDLYEAVKGLPIFSPHGHCDPTWWAQDAAFPDPATLLIVPDHYVFRMLYSQGVSLEALGIGKRPDDRDPRQVFQILADHWHCFLGTPSREWLNFTLHKTLDVRTELSPTSAQRVYDEIAEKLTDPAFRPRALFEAFQIEVLATTDAATDPLEAHRSLAQSGWDGRIIPTFRPDSVLNPERPDFAKSVAELAQVTGQEIGGMQDYLEALRIRRAYFKTLGATATDHDVPELETTPLPQDTLEALFHRARTTGLSIPEARAFYGHMLVEMAGMSIDDGMVMQIHAGSTRNTNPVIFEKYGLDMGADMPRQGEWVQGLDGLLRRYGNDPALRVILFTLDETTYARDLAPLAGHWPCLRIGPPWWFHDSTNGIRRYLDQVVETAGYFNLSGFNDDTRAFLSIPARHNTWRRGVALHLAAQIDTGKFSMTDAEMLAQQLCRDLAITAYRLDQAEL